MAHDLKDLAGNYIIAKEAEEAAKADTWRAYHALWRHPVVKDGLFGIQDGDTPDGFVIMVPELNQMLLVTAHDGRPVFRAYPIYQPTPESKA